MPFRGERDAHKHSASVRCDHDTLSSSHKLEAIEDLRVVLERITTDVWISTPALTSLGSLYGGVLLDCLSYLVSVAVFVAVRRVMSGCLLSRPF
jgi:acyl-CoA hydrolase